MTELHWPIFIKTPVIIGLHNGNFLFTQLQSQSSIVFFDFMGLTIVVKLIQAAHTGGTIPNVASNKQHQPRLGLRPIKDQFTSFLLVLCTTTTRVELRLEARPIPCLSMLEEEAEACSPFVTCIRVPGRRTLVTWLEEDAFKDYKPRAT